MWCEEVGTKLGTELGTATLACRGRQPSAPACPWSASLFLQGCIRWVPGVHRSFLLLDVQLKDRPPSTVISPI